MTKGLTWDEVVKLGCALPETAEGSYHGMPSLKTRGKDLTHHYPEHNAITIKLGSIDERDALLDLDPTLYHITDHFKGWPYLMMRLDQADRDVTLAHLINMWRGRVTKKMAREFDEAQK